MEQARSPRPLLFLFGRTADLCGFGLHAQPQTRFQFRLFGAPDRAGLRTGDTGAEQEWTRARAEELLLRVGEEGNYLKHYFPEPDRLKVFIRGGSSLTVDLASGHAVYESIRKRPVLSSLNRLHYNPSRWWTVFSDVFLAGLIVIVLSGLVMMRGPKGLRGRGGVELIAGILIPLLFIFLT